MGLAVMARPPAPKGSTRPPVAPPPDWRPHSLGAGTRAFEIPAASDSLKGTLAWPSHPSGFVLIARARGGMQASARDASLALQLRADGLGTLLFDRSIGHRAHSLELRAERLRAATEWLAAQPEAAGLPLGYLDTGIGAAAALVVASSSAPIGAVVSCGGWPDLLTDRLSTVRVPTLLIVGDRDEQGLRLSLPALVRLGGPKWLTTIPGAGPRFEEAGVLKDVGSRAAQWFIRHLVMEPAWRAAHTVEESGAGR